MNTCQVSSDKYKKYNYSTVRLLRYVAKCYLGKINLEPMQLVVISDGACHLRCGLRGKCHAL